jgi:archaellum component FlaC
VNVEALLWIGGLVIEALVVAAVVLAVMLRRSQRARRQLLAQPEPKAAPPAETPVAVAAGLAAEPAVAIEIAENDWIDGDKDAAASTQLDTSTERLQQRLDVTNESLQRLEAGLEQGAHPEIATLKDNLQGMTSEIDSLQQNSAKLRSDMTTLRDKLRHSEIDVQKLQTEKEALAAEYAALSQEYERVYANSDKNGA